MKKCVYCRTQNLDDSLFCTECGKPLPIGVETEDESDDFVLETSDHADNSFKSKIIKQIIIGIILLALIIFLVLF